MIYSNKLTKSDLKKILPSNYSVVNCVSRKFRVFCSKMFSRVSNFLNASQVFRIPNYKETKRILKTV